MSAFIIKVQTYIERLVNCFATCTQKHSPPFPSAGRSAAAIIQT